MVEVKSIGKRERVEEEDRKPHGRGEKREAKPILLSGAQSYNN